MYLEITINGRFINIFSPNIIRSIRINKKVCRQKCLLCSIKYVSIYIYVYIYIYIYIYSGRITLGLHSCSISNHVFRSSIGPQLIVSISNAKIILLCSYKNSIHFVFTKDSPTHLPPLPYTLQYQLPTVNSRNKKNHKFYSTLPRQSYF